MITDELLIRDLNLNDYLRLWNFAKDLERRGQVTASFFWPPEMVVAELQTHLGLGGFLDQGDELVAYILYRKFLPQYEIISLVTHPDHRQKGLMQKLLVSFLQRLGPHDEVLLEVHEKNLSARNLYLKIGFIEVGQRPRYYKDGATALVLAWKGEGTR